MSDAIKADNTLTTDEKNAQLAEVESDRVKANQNIDNAADADAVNQAVAAGKSAIDADHVPGTPTDGQKNDPRRVTSMLKPRRCPLLSKLIRL
ncbi:DUF1542 domain-containing protein [Fructobacillus fructosus]|uniref:DUF1542 domain-containing protein n=1 Tax=Fructobacillus fructosus TaxID=1631 RepID=UPI0002195D9F|nr:DUF1542 domain-containing protein [Fructobacillus fructosus]